MQLDYVVTGTVGYLLGSIPVALLVARRHGVDLHRTADGNPDAWNALAQLGARRAWPAFAGDGIKGLLAGLLGLLVGDIWTAYAGVAAAMLAHAFPAFGRLRGGKGVMTFVGGMLALSPLAWYLALAVAVGTCAHKRSLAWGARAGVAAIVPLQLVLDGSSRTAATGGLMCIIGALFAFRRMSVRATSASGAARTT